MRDGGLTTRASVDLGECDKSVSALTLYQKAVTTHHDFTAAPTLRSEKLVRATSELSGQIDGVSI
jgi:hypothetical protein